MIYLKYIAFIITLYVSILVAIIVPSFEKLKTNLVEKHKIQNNLLIDNFMTKIEMVLLDNKYTQIKQYMDNFVATNIVDSLSINYTNYFVTVNYLLSSSNNIKTKDWVLNDVTMDYKYGKIEKLTDTIYKFEPKADYDFTKPIEIKFQALNDTQMENSISKINFSLPKVTIQKIRIEKSYLETKFEELLEIQDGIVEKKFYADSKHDYATLKCVTNNTQLKNETKNALLELWKFYTLCFGLILLFGIFFHFYIQKFIFVKKIKDIDIYLNDVLNNNFYKFKGLEKIKQKEILSLVKNILKLTKNLSVLNNELTHNRNLIEAKISSDTLTKLPNKKIFEIDMKGLFVDSKDSYITKIKLEILKTFSNDNSSDLIDDLVMDFVDMITQALKINNQKNSKLYRLYGSEFILITKYTNYKNMNDLLELLFENSNLIIEKYNLTSKLSFGVSAAFDKYGTIDQILINLENIYNHAISDNQIKQKYYFVENSQQQDEQALRLEKIVKSIIDNDAFALSYKFNAYEFNNPEKLIMQEVSPNLCDTNGVPIPVATFISVAEHLHLAIDFDKQLIVKTLKYIKQNEVKHDLAINISISSLNDKSFNTWLESQLLFYDYETISRVVFSVTTFAVKNNYEQFAMFIKDIKKFDGRILLKRFSYNDLTLAQLENLELDFMRVHKDYTTNIDTDRGVLLKNIASFCEIHDIKLLGDAVTLDSDYELLKKLNFYATSR